MRTSKVRFLSAAPAPVKGRHLLDVSYQVYGITFQYLFFSFYLSCLPHTDNARTAYYPRSAAGHIPPAFPHYTRSTQREGV